MMEAKTISFTLAGGSSAAAIARRSVLSIEAGLPLGVRHRVALVLSELIANAVQHGGAGPTEMIHVRVESSGSRLRVEVLDPGWGDSPPARRIQHPDGGYGLLLVAHLADDHGREPSEEGDGSVAWFEIELDDFGEP
jgi:anti-sigma regulatory factor (Ser/Thr protein kinase)